MVHLFDENNQQSILGFTKKLEGRTLREFLSDEDINSIEESIKEKQIGRAHV